MYNFQILRFKSYTYPIHHKYCICI